MLAFLVSLAIAATLLAPFAQSLPLQRESLSLEEDTEGPASTCDETTPSQDEQYNEPPVRRHVPNFTAPNGPGSLCRQQSDCDDSLVCLASSACGCPEVTPVVLYDEASFTCVSPRRLSEFCQSDAECRHEDDHARCLESSCRCQSLFYDPGDGSRCLPDTLTWNGIKTTILSAVLLIVGFIVLGTLGYHRLHKSWGYKSRQSHDLSTAMEDNSSCEWFSARPEYPAGVDGGLASDAVSSWMHSIAARLQATKHRWKRSRLIPSKYESQSTGDHATSLNHYSIQSNTRAQANCILKSTPSGTTQSMSPHEHLSASDATSQTTVDASPSNGAGHCSKQTIPVKGTPVPSPRTRIATLSTSTLMPTPRASRRRNVSSSSGMLTFTSFYTGNPQSVTNSEMSSLRYETVEEENANEPDKLLALQTRAAEAVKFTESELRAETLKKFTSEKVVVPVARRSWRAFSDYHNPLAVISEEKTESSCSCCCHNSPNVKCYRTSAESSSSTFRWGTESCMKVFANEHSERRCPDSMLTHSQLTWPCERVLSNVLERRARTCEAFTFHCPGPRPKVIRRRIVSPVMRRTPRMPLMSFGRRPASGDESVHRRSGGVRRSMPYRGAHSAIVALSPAQVRSLASRLSTPRNSYGYPRRSVGSCSRRPTTRGSSPAARAYQSAPLIPRVAQVARFSRGAQTLDSALESTAGSAGRRGSDDSYSSFSFSRSDCSNLPLSVSTLRSGRTNWSQDTDGSSGHS